MRLGPAATAIAVTLAFAVGCERERGDTALLAGSNVIVVLVDTLRADYLGAFGHPLPTSPSIDRIVAESVVFDKVVAPASQTVPSMLSLWSGVYPNRHGNQYFAGKRAFRMPTPGTAPRVPGYVTFVSERLRERGYKTGAVVTNPWLKADFGFDRGFDSYEYLLERPHFARGAKVNEAARELLDEWKGHRFLLWLHYMDIHTPYEEDPKYRDAFPPDPAEHKGVALLKHGYNAEVRAVDDYVRDLLEIIRERGLEKNTLVVFTSDHGEEFGEHGAFGHGQALYQELVHVPLLFKHPELAPRRIETPVSLVDIAPTVLELVTGSVGGGLDGVSLVPEITGNGAPTDDRILFSELGTMTAARRGDKKLIRTANAEVFGQEAYDLGADPEEKNAVDPQSRWIADLSAAIDAHMARRVAPTGSPETIDPATEERVRALGY